MSKAAAFDGQTIRLGRSYEIDVKTGECRLFGQRIANEDPLPLINKLVQILGPDSGRSLVFTLWLEEGKEVYKAALDHMKQASSREVLKELLDAEVFTGWGITGVKQEAERITVEISHPLITDTTTPAIAVYPGYWVGVLSTMTEKPYMQNQSPTTNTRIN